MDKLIHLHKLTEQTIKSNLPNKKVINKLTYFYSIFNDSTRIKILIALLLSKMCVNDLSKILDLNQTTVSHQLKYLKSCGVVSSTRINKFNFYEVSNKFVELVMLNGFDYILEKNAI